MALSSPPRPAHLPDFEKPPLNEVVLGIQFAPARNYRQILAGEVWRLFKADFPNVEEMPPLQPAFELFGAAQPPIVKFGMITGALHDRFWFISKQKDELIQFQPDRLLHNWRKVGDETNQYPRFENMIAAFEREIDQLEGFFATLAPQTIVCNQAEISYVNHIPLTSNGVGAKVDDWLRFLQFGAEQPEDASGVWRRVLRTPDGRPTGRLTCETASFVKPPGIPALSLTLTVRGAPENFSTASSLEFLKRGREVIVKEFAAITTDSAHQAWGRIR